MKNDYNPKGIKRLLRLVKSNINRQLESEYDPTSKYSVLRLEGYNGGYRDALMDVALALNGITPDRNGWWNASKDG
jgi:hypothetical protein